MTKCFFAGRRQGFDRVYVCRARVEADTRAEALKNIREAIALYVEDCRDAGDPVPTEAGKEFVEVEAA